MVILSLSFHLFLLPVFKNWLCFTLGLMRSMSLLVGPVVYFLSHLFSLGSSDRSHNEKRVNMSSLKTVDLKMIRGILPEEITRCINYWNKNKIPCS